MTIALSGVVLYVEVTVNTNIDYLAKGRFILVAAGSVHLIDP